MKTQELLNAFQDVDSAYLTEADAAIGRPQRRHIARYIGGLAGAAAVICGVAVGMKALPQGTTVQVGNSPYGTVDRLLYVDGHGGNQALTPESDAAKSMYTAFQAMMTNGEAGSMAEPVPLDGQFRGIQMVFQTPAEIAVSRTEQDTLKAVSAVWLPENTALNTVYFEFAGNTEDVTGFTLTPTAEYAAALAALIPQDAAESAWYAEIGEIWYNSGGGAQLIENPIGETAAAALGAALDDFFASGSVTANPVPGASLGDFDRRAVLRLWLRTPHTFTVQSASGAVTAADVNTVMLSETADTVWLMAGAEQAFWEITGAYPASLRDATDEAGTLRDEAAEAAARNAAEQTVRDMAEQTLRDAAVKAAAEFAALDVDAWHRNLSALRYYPPEYDPLSCYETDPTVLLDHESEETQKLLSRVTTVLYADYCSPAEGEPNEPAGYLEAELASPQWVHIGFAGGGGTDVMNVTALWIPPEGIGAYYLCTAEGETFCFTVEDSAARILGVIQ